jgi:uncharacterized protein
MGMRAGIHMRAIATALAAVSLAALTGASQPQPPIIDMHMHARVAVQRAADGSVVGRPCDPQPCETPAPVVTADEEVRVATVRAMRRHNIVLGFLGDSIDRVDRWMAHGPDASLFMPATFPSQATDGTTEKVAALRRLVDAHRIEAIGEIGTQYSGIAPNDPRLDPYFALAEERDLPVLIHTAGLGAHLPKFRAALGSPLLLEDVVVKHPRLRLYFENAGYPFLDAAIALMTQYPQVYADVSTITWIIPRPAFYRYLKALVDAGLGKRLMFGSDQMEWPETIDLAIDAVESADFLTAEQKRDIFYNNAARFLRRQPR